MDALDLFNIYGLIDSYKLTQKTDENEEDFKIRIITLLHTNGHIRILDQKNFTLICVAVYRLGKIK